MFLNLRLYFNFKITQKENSKTNRFRIRSYLMSIRNSSTYFFSSNFNFLTLFKSFSYTKLVNFTGFLLEIVSIFFNFTASNINYAWIKIRNGNFMGRCC